MINKSAAARLSILAAIGLSFASLAVPAQAAQKENGKAAASSVALSAASSVAGRPAGTLYCLREAHTGTRIPRKICKTEREWAAEGVELSRR